MPWNKRPERWRDERQRKTVRPRARQAAHLLESLRRLPVLALPLLLFKSIVAWREPWGVTIGHNRKERDKANHSTGNKLYAKIGGRRQY